MDLMVGQLENREGRLWKQEYENLEKKKTTNLEEGFKNEENARHVIQKELAVVKDEHLKKIIRKDARDGGEGRSTKS